MESPANKFVALLQSNPAAPDRVISSAPKTGATAAAPPTSGAATPEQMINSMPAVQVQTRVAVCDGGTGALGHPRVYIKLDKPHQEEPCGYCGLRYVNVNAH